MPMGCLQNWEDWEGMLKVIHKGLRFEVDCDNEKNYHRSLLYRRKALQWLTIMKITIITLITRLIKMIRGIGGRSRSDWPMTIMKITKITLITLLIKMIRGVGGRSRSDWLMCRWAQFSTSLRYLTSQLNCALFFSFFLLLFFPFWLFYWKKLPLLASAAISRPGF